MKILIIAEHDNKILKPATLATISAANKLLDKIPGEISVLVAGYECEKIAQQVAKYNNIQEVLIADYIGYKNFLAENIAALIEKISVEFDYFLAPATTFGKNFMPRLAALLDVAQISDVTGIVSEDTFMRPIYAGNAIETVQNLAPKKVLTIRSTAFADCKKQEQKNITKIIVIKEEIDLKLSNYISCEAPSAGLNSSARPELTAAKVVISGGRGLQNADNFKILEKLADKLNAAIGASRAAVDAGFVANDLQVGQTGKIVAPDLYMAVGISGAIQHLTGIKDSKIIVAINKDPEAPIFEIADYGLVGDLFEIIPELIDLLEA